MFQSTLLYSLINWGKATKSCLRQLEVLQNRLIRANSFLPKMPPSTKCFKKILVLKRQKFKLMEISSDTFLKVT